MLMASTPANAALSLCKSYVGSYGLSTDGAGTNGGSTTISAFVPFGATVTAAYLYQSTNFATQSDTITLNGNNVSFGPRIANSTACCDLASARADVTSLIAPTINGGAGGTYDFTVGEGSSGTTDGTALVVVYSLASLATQTVAVLDGFSAVGGDTASFNFGTPLDPTAPGFGAEMRLGIGFSFPPQSSNVTVNGTQITSVAGGYDDGVASNGALITVGGSDDPFSSLLPAYDDDHERYNLAPYITAGSTSIKIDTNNPSGDDNIFLAAFVVSGEATVVTPGVPEPATWSMLITGFGLSGMAMRRRRQVARA